MKVLVFNHTFFNISETFIYKQIIGMPAEIDVSLLSYSFVNEESFPLNVPKKRIDRWANSLDKVISSGLRRVLGLQLGFTIVNYFSVKRFLQKHRFDLIHAHFGFNALIALPLARALKIPLVVTFHGLDASPQLLKDAKYKRRLPALFDYAKAIIVVSPHMFDTLELEKWKHKTHLLPYGVDPSEFINEPPSEVPPPKLRILHSGRLVSKKGVPDLINAFRELSAKYPNIQLDLIGDGPENDVSRQAAAGHDRIFFHGAQSHNVVRQMMRESHIFVLNSRVGDNGDMEGLPVSLLEAMSMSLPIVTTRHAGIPQAISDGENGLLVDERDNAGLKAALDKIIADPHLRFKLGTTARHTVEARFTMQGMNSRIVEIYKS